MFPKPANWIETSLSFDVWLWSAYNKQLQDWLNPLDLIQIFINLSSHLWLCIAQNDRDHPLIIDSSDSSAPAVLPLHIDISVKYIFSWFCFPCQKGKILKPSVQLITLPLVGRKTALESLAQHGDPALVEFIIFLFHFLSRTIGQKWLHQHVFLINKFFFCHIGKIPHRDLLQFC